MARSKDYSAFKKVSKTLKSISDNDLEIELEKDLRRGVKSRELREKYLARVTAKSILIALTGNEKSANSAIRDLTDRHEGRAVERKEVRHHLEKLTDQEVEAMLLTEIDDLQVEKAVKGGKPQLQ